jgi:hypothetical protein
MLEESQSRRSLPISRSKIRILALVLISVKKIKPSLMVSTMLGRSLRKVLMMQIASFRKLSLNLSRKLTALSRTLRRNVKTTKRTFNNRLLTEMKVSKTQLQERSSKSSKLPQRISEKEKNK